MIRVEVTYYEGVTLCSIFATNGRVLGRGYGSTEEGARYAAALDFADREAELDVARVRATPSRRRRVSHAGGAPCRRSTTIDHTPRSAPLARFVHNASRFGIKPGGERP